MQGGVNYPIRILSMRKLFFISVLFVFLLLALAGAAELAVRYQPVEAAVQENDDLPTELEWVWVRVDERMFTLFAALNMAGYDRENFGADYHPARQLVRERLAGKTFSGQSRLRQELKFVDAYNFVVWALHYGGPPEFTRQETWAANGMPAFFFYGLDQVLRDFYRELDITSLWQEVKPLYELEAARYQQAAGPAIRAALAYIRMEQVLIRQVIAIPNLLDAHWSGFGPQVGDTAYVVVGPTREEPDVGLIQHEALHSLVGPLVEANLEAIDPQHANALFAALRKRVPKNYGSWEIIVEESVVRALDARLAGPEWEENSLRNDEQAGFLLVRPLADILKTYEACSETLEEFMPELLARLNQVDPQTLLSEK